LVTDVVDSTRVVEALGDEGAASLWAAHDRVARDLLSPHGGREIDKTDGFLLLFESAASALAYAGAYHLAIAELEPPLQARAGLHVGSVVLRDNPAADVALGAKPLEVEGIAKPTAARVMSVAHGGQTLLTSSAAQDLDELHSHGFWRLKGVAEPMELFESSAHPRSPEDGAKVYRVVRANDIWLPVAEVPHNLPRERDVFVGRVEDLAELAGMAQRAPLVSVLGIGGTGKTRMCIRYGWSWLGEWPGGVWFCDLSEARSTADIAAVLARVLDVPLSGAGIDQLGHALDARGRCLVILDNFEQVAAHAPDTLGVWLDSAPSATFVVTTREVLGLPGEVMLALAPLSQDAAVALFSARSSAVKRDFRPGDAGVLRELVDLLDRLPLAIELAAARARVMSPEVILHRMSQRFKLLAGRGRRDRQSTLRGAIDWSWDLLEGWEKDALSQVSVFEGGFTLEAAEAVLDIGEEVWPMDAVQSLVDKSLVVARDGRFDLLVSVQEYAAEKLVESGRIEGAEIRHGEHFAALGDSRIRKELHKVGHDAVREEVLAELDNTHAALRRAIERKDRDLGAALSTAYWTGLQLRGPFTRALPLLQAVRALDPTDWPAVEQDIAAVLVAQGRPLDALPHLDAAERGFRAAGDQVALATLLGNRGAALYSAGRFAESRVLHEQALALQREHQAPGMEVVALGNLGAACFDLGLLDEGEAHLRESLRLNERFGDLHSEGVFRILLSALLSTQHRTDEARVHAERALEIARAIADQMMVGRAHGQLAAVLSRMSRYDEASTHYDAAIEAARSMGHVNFEALVLGNKARMFKKLGQTSTAIALAERALARASGPHLWNAQRTLGDLYRIVGRRKEALALVHAALDGYRGAGDTTRVADCLQDLANLYHGERALELLEQELEIRREIGVANSIGIAMCNIGHAHRRSGRAIEARGWFQKALDVAHGEGDTAFIGHLHSCLAEMDVCLGDVVAARAAIEVAEPMMREARHLPGLADLLVIRARIELAEGVDAADTLAEAAEYAERMGVGPDSELRRGLRELSAPGATST
jgi:predicted ATPase/class 3 adenylate cyclase/Tfp pilus assembly protein PilF